MQRHGQADIQHNPNPNSLLAPEQSLDNPLFGLDDANATQAMADKAEFDPELPRSVIKAPPGPSLDIEGGSPFGTTGSNAHHQTLHDLAAKAVNPMDLVRRQLVEILEKLTNQAPYLQVVGQTNPELYDSVNGLVKLVIQLARGQGLSKSDRKSPAEQMAESIKSQHPKHDCKSGDCYYATEALYHLLGGESSGATPHAAQDHWYLKTGTGKALHPTEAPSPAEGRPRKLVTEHPSKEALAILGTVLKQGPLKKAEPAFNSGKAAFAAAKQTRQYLKLPVGSTKGNKIKIAHANGTSGWRQVAAGMVQGLEPDAPLLAANSHPVSVKRPFDD